MRSLEEQIITEANLDLQRLRDANSNIWTYFMGAFIFGTGAIFGYKEGLFFIIFFSVIFVFFASLSLYSRYQVKILFDKIRKDCTKLQDSGFVVFRASNWARLIPFLEISKTEPSKQKVIDFKIITCSNFIRLMDV